MINIFKTCWHFVYIRKESQFLFLPLHKKAHEINAWWRKILNDKAAWNCITLHVCLMLGKSIISPPPLLSCSEALQHHPKGKFIILTTSIFALSLILSATMTSTSSPLETFHIYMLAIISSVFPLAILIYLLLTSQGTWQSAPSQPSFWWNVWLCCKSQLGFKQRGKEGRRAYKEIQSCILYLFWVMWCSEEHHHGGKDTRACYNEMKMVKKISVLNGSWDQRWCMAIMEGREGLMLPC